MHAPMGDMLRPVLETPDQLETPEPGRTAKERDSLVRVERARAVWADPEKRAHIEAGMAKRDKDAQRGRLAATWNEERRQRQSQLVVRKRREHGLSTAINWRKREAPQEAQLNALEQRVFPLLHVGMAPAAIARKLERRPQTIYNVIQRLKQKTVEQ